VGFVYTPTTGYNGIDSFTYKAADNVVTSTPATVTITVSQFAPTITAPPTASLSENGSLVFSSTNGNAISFTDANAGSKNTESLTLSVAHGTLTLGSTTGLTFKTGKNNTASFTVTGTAANLNAALSGLAFRPTAAYFGPDALAISVSNSLDGQSASTSVLTRRPRIREAFSSALDDGAVAVDTDECAT
jgi:hypothetical protein